LAKLLSRTPAGPNTFSALSVIEAAAGIRVKTTGPPPVAATAPGTPAGLGPRYASTATSPAGTGSGTRYDMSAGGSTSGTIPGYRAPQAGIAPPATTNTPGAGAYLPGQTDYQPGKTGYNPPNVPPYNVPAYQPSGGAATDAAAPQPFRPGSTSSYAPVSATIGAGGTAIPTAGAIPSSFPGNPLAQP